MKFNDRLESVGVDMGKFILRGTDIIAKFKDHPEEVTVTEFVSATTAVMRNMMLAFEETQQREILMDLVILRGKLLANGAYNVSQTKTIDDAGAESLKQAQIDFDNAVNKWKAI